MVQESKLYGAHFREIDPSAAKATKIKFDNSDDEDWFWDTKQYLNDNILVQPVAAGQ